MSAFIDERRRDFGVECIYRPLVGEGEVVLEGHRELPRLHGRRYLTRLEGRFGSDLYVRGEGHD